MEQLKLLIAVGDAAPGPDRLPAGIRALIEAAEEILVISPRLPGRLEWLASATDRAEEKADERLRTVLGQLREIGADAEGEVGADDPLLAFEDAVRRFSPTHILVGLREEDRAGWQERGLLEALRDRFPIPITTFELGTDAGADR